MAPDARLFVHERGAERDRLLIRRDRIGDPTSIRPCCSAHLARLDGVVELEVVLETGLATITLEEDADVSNELLQKTVKEAGFGVGKITRNFESEFADYDRDATD